MRQGWVILCLEGHVTCNAGSNAECPSVANLSLETICPSLRSPNKYLEIVATSPIYLYFLNAERRDGVVRIVKPFS